MQILGGFIKKKLYFPESKIRGKCQNYTRVVIENEHKLCCGFFPSPGRTTGVGHPFNTGSGWELKH